RTFAILVGVISAMSTSLAATANDDPPASLLVVGRVWTADARRPWVDAVAVRDDKIFAVGSRAELSKFRDGKTKVIDAGAGMVVPGLIDSHIHLIDGGLQLASVQLRDAKTRDDFVRRIG